MKIRGILTERMNQNWRSAQIVYEWEDTISSHLNIPIINVKKLYHIILWRIIKLKLGKLLIFIDSLRPVNNYYLYFNMTATTDFKLTSFKNIIPVIIDFWLKESKLKEFYKVHSNCKLMLISSKEVYEFLKKQKCPIPIVHFPLSLPDKYISKDLLNYKKTIDFLFAGRRDTVFWNYIKMYEKENPDIEYVYQEMHGKIPSYISNKRGKLAGDYFSRELYTKLLQNAKITFYSTPGEDPSKEGANGFNQVTPRFLELLSSGCLVMGRYLDNPDTDFYQLNEFCIKITSYQEFKRTVELFSDEKFVKKQMSKYHSYLLGHSTSSRTILLKRIISA
jgi:hypothetical protein